jgi:hypothetical protein
MMVPVRVCSKRRSHLDRRKSREIMAHVLSSSLDSATNSSIRVTTSIFPLKKIMIYDQNANGNKILSKPGLSSSQRGLVVVYRVSVGIKT